VFTLGSTYAKIDKEHRLRLQTLVPREQALDDRGVIVWQQLVNQTGDISTQIKRRDQYLRQNPEFEVDVAESLVVDLVNTYALGGEIVG
jgi:hypothetical protein